MTDKEKRKQVTKISVFITSIFVIFLSISYAFINQTLRGTKKQVITAGNLQLNLTEGDSITLENALPMYDEVGMMQKPFSFSLENTTETPTNCILKLADVTSAGSEKLDTYVVKYGLEKNGERTIQKLSGLENGVLDQGEIEGNETINYTLRLWIDHSTEDEILLKNKSISYRIQVESSQEIAVSYKGMMEARQWNQEYLGGTWDIFDTKYYVYKDDITSAIFESKINVPEDISEDKKWDISEKQDGSVVAYLENGQDTEVGEVGYKLHIQANGRVLANENSSGLFSGFANLLFIEGMENLDLSRVKVFSAIFNENQELLSIFGNCPKLRLDLSDLNTSNVENMSGMFSNYNSSHSLDLSELDTSKVTDMSFMFRNYSSSQPLSLSRLDTTNVTNMSSMFRDYSSSQPLDLSSFNTSNVENMSGMFSYYRSSQPLDLRNFDTSNVTNMSSMFENYRSSQPLDLSSFNTSNVENMSFMFNSYESQASLDISSFDFSSVTEIDDIFYRIPEYYASPILVKDDAMKAWVLEENSKLTNVTIKP